MDSVHHLSEQIAVTADVFGVRWIDHLLSYGAHGTLARVCNAKNNVCWEASDTPSLPVPVFILNKLLEEESVFFCSLLFFQPWFSDPIAD